MPMPKKNHIRLVIYVSKEFQKSIKRESKQRQKTLGDLVEEAFTSRITVTNHGRSMSE